ncbi:MAG: hypothetical protein SXA11_10840 [Cyanobacteriota bacterium]|nr:hypothetical protein [Cyanobacteriota bacterium]
MLSIFRSRYPTARLISELATVHNGKYIVRTLVQVNGENIGSGLAAAETVELAEAKARKRAIENLELDSTTSVSQSPKAVSSVAPPPSIATAAQPASQKLTEVAATRDVVKNQTKTKTKSKTQTKTQVDKEPPTATPEERPPIASTLTKEPVTIPNESDRFDSDDWLNSSSSSSSEFEANPLGGSGELIDSLPEIGSDRSTPQKDSIGSSMESQTPSTGVTAGSAPLDLSNTTATIDVLLNNLNWSKERERDYLELTYGEKLRSLLNEEKLLDFQEYLEILAKVTAKIKSLGWNPKQEKDYLKNNQSGKTREQLNANELTEFFEYLEIFDKTTENIKELGWTNEQGKDYLQETYGVVARTRLSLEQLQDFLLYLESLTTS